MCIFWSKPLVLAFRLSQSWPHPVSSEMSQNVFNCVFTYLFLRVYGQMELQKMKASQKPNSQLRSGSSTARRLYTQPDVVCHNSIPSHLISSHLTSSDLTWTAWWTMSSLVQQLSEMKSGEISCLRPVAASILWNSLPSDIQSSPSLSVFCQRRLKTFIFRQSFPDFLLWLYYASVDFVIVLLF